MLLGCRRGRFLVALALAGACFLGAAGGAKADLRAQLRDLLASHNLVKAARDDAASAGQRLDETRGVWYPTLNVTGSVGREDQINSNADDTTLTARELDVSVTQRLYDFGASDATIEQSRLERRAAEASSDLAAQDILLQGLIAHLNLLRAAEVLDFAQRSERNIAAQEQIEADRLAAGGGQGTDLLQVRSQLAAARARRVRAAGDVQLARNLYKRVYGYFPELSVLREVPTVERERLPESVDAAVGLALDNNLRLEATRLSTEALDEAVRLDRADKLFPTLNAVGQVIARNDADGIRGYERDAIAKIELLFPFNLGFTALNSIRAAELTSSAGHYRLAQVRNEIEELVRNAWQNLRTAQSNAALLRDQAELANEFLELAREERRLGSRSLLDVLAGETALLNARADATAARRDVAINAFTVLGFISDLRIDQISVAPYAGPLRLPPANGG